MGKIEQKVKRRLRKKDLLMAILGVVGIAGMLTATVVAPNVIGALGKMGIIGPRKRRKEIINRARDRLIEYGLLEHNKTGYLCLTKKGEYELHKLEFSEATLKKPKRWDKKWRVLIFDIPESRKGTRYKLRLTLLAVGFKRLQDSVWVHPYPCEDFIALIKTDFKVGKEVLYIVTDEIEGDTSLRARFGLLDK